MPLFASEKVQQLSFQVLLDIVPTVCVPPLTNVPPGKISVPVSPLPLEVQLIFEKDSASPLASVRAAGSYSGTVLYTMTAP